MLKTNYFSQSGQWCLRGQEAFAGVCIGLRGATPRVKTPLRKEVKYGVVKK